MTVIFPFGILRFIEFSALFSAAGYLNERFFTVMPALGSFTLSPLFSSKKHNFGKRDPS
jgi:hypothetical protein